MRLKIIRRQATPYGQADFDRDYMDWGFNDEHEHMENAKMLSAFFPEGTRALIDIACGVGKYHKVWINQGIEVTGSDLSRTFLDQARIHNPMARYLQADSRLLP